MRVEVSLLGDFAVVVDGRAVGPERWGGERGRALVKLLALSRGHRLHREQVIDALWPELSPRAAAPRLHKATHMARKALGDRAVVATSEGALMLWPSAELVVDVDRFESLATDARTVSANEALAEALDVYRGDLLPDDLYEPWTDAPRQRLRERHRELLQMAGRWDALLAIDAADEAAHLALAQLAVNAGDRAGALRRLDELERVLEQELGVSPSDAAVRLRAVAEALPVDVPVQHLRPTGIGRGMPTPLTPFIGRAAELDQLRAALTTHRLVTATGAGGAGKTRLAIEASRQYVDERDVAVVFVDLVRVGPHDSVAAAFADAAAVPEHAGVDRLDTLVAALGDAPLLLVADNCEHVADGARVCIERLLSQCPLVSILATSRVRLMLPFERVVNVPGLSLDDTDGVSDAERLFVDRTLSAGAELPQDVRGRTLVAEICRRLDGLALAIELAAGRVPGFGLEGLVDALDNSIDVLEMGRRAEDRHRSMAAAIGWSYDQLGADEQAVLRAGAVFSTPFDLEALAAVIQRRPGSVAAALGRLVDWNLIALRPGVPTRYRILETIRQHADAMSVALDESDQLHQAHLSWCRGAVAALARRQPHDDDWCVDVDLVAAESGGALTWAADHAESDATAAELAELLAGVLFDRGRPGEAQRRYELAAASAAGPSEQRRLLRLAAGAAAARNVGVDAVALYERSAAAALGDGDHDAAAQDLAQAAGLQYRAAGIMAEAAPVATIDARLDLARATSRGGSIAEAAIAVADGWVAGAAAHSRHRTSRAIDLAQRAQQPLLLNEALDQLTALELDERNLPGALDAIDRRLQLLRDLPLDATTGFEVYDALHMACHVNLASGRLRAARRYADDVASLPFVREESHIGLGRRVEVDAIAGDFDAVISRADLFERDWWRAGRPVAGNLAVGAYAAAMTFGMLDNVARRGQWIDITNALLGPTGGLHSRFNIWAAALDAMLALHGDDPETALSLLTRSPGDALDNPNHVLWLPWYAAVWAEASVLAHHPASDERLDIATTAAAGNDIATAIIERSRSLRSPGADAISPLVARFTDLDCPYQADRTRALASARRV